MAIHELPSGIDDLRAAQRDLSQRLEQVRRRVRLHLIIEGLFWVACAVVLAIALSLATDRILRLERPARWALLVLAIAGIVAVAVIKLVRPLMVPLEDLDLAELLDRRARGVGQHISNVLELPDLLASQHDGSPALVRAAVIECAGQLERVDFASTLNVPRRTVLWRGILGLLVLVAAFSLLWPATAGLWARRWLAGSTTRWPQNTYLAINGLGDSDRLLVPRGEPTLLQISSQPELVEVNGGWQVASRGAPLVIEGDKPSAMVAPEQISIMLVPGRGITRRASAVQFDESSFRYELPALNEPAELSIVGGDDWLGPIVIEPIDRPAIQKLEIVARRPGSEEADRQVAGDASAQFLYLPETELELHLTASENLKSATVLDKAEPLAGLERIDKQTYRLPLVMKQSLALEFRLVGEHGELDSKPYYLAIGLLKDREPRLTIRSSGVGRRVTPVARIPLNVRANDDFGVATMSLDVERTVAGEEQSKATPAHIELGAANADELARTDIELNHELSLAEQKAAPGNVLRVRATGLDNCALGQQAGASRWLSFQVVNSDDLFYEILMRLREQRAKFAAALESERAQAKGLKSLEAAEQAVAAARSQQVINRQVWQATGIIEAALVEMAQNDLGNAQAREMLQTGVITPLHTLNDELLLRLRTTIDTLARAPLPNEPRRVEAQELAEQAVEQMQAILSQMSQWESFVDVVNQLKQIIERQNELLRRSEETEKKRTNEFFD